LYNKLGTIPYDKLWHDMDRDNQNLAVRRVHEVIFSQVMALTHSMIELGKETVGYGLYIVYLYIYILVYDKK